MGIIYCNVRRRFMSDKIFCIIFVKASLNHANLKSVMETSSLLFSSPRRLSGSLGWIPFAGSLAFPLCLRAKIPPSHLARS